MVMPLEKFNQERKWITLGKKVSNKVKISLEGGKGGVPLFGDIGFR